ncbi:MAG: RNA polymerase sigma factor [Rubripirellula sp.]
MPDSVDESINLFARLRAGDSEAADDLFRRYLLRLVALVESRMSPHLRRRVDAEDVVQSTYHTFFAKAEQGRFELKQGGDLWRLLAAIAMNKLAKQWERNLAAKRSLAVEQSGNHPKNSGHDWIPRSREPSPDDQAMVDDEIEQLTDGFDETQSDMLALRLAGMRIDEIAVHTNRSERTVRRLLEKVRYTMQTRLDTLAES